MSPPGSWLLYVVNAVVATGCDQGRGKQAREAWFPIDGSGHKPGYALTLALVPAGTWFPPCGRKRVFSVFGYAAATSLPQRNAVPSTHMRWRMTASLRATASLAFSMPARLATRSPQAFSAHHRFNRVRMLWAAS